MTHWADTRIQDLLGIQHPIIQAPMAGCSTPAMAAAVGNAGGMGSLGCAMLTAAGVVAAADGIRQNSNAGFNLNFFCHKAPKYNAAMAAKALERLKPWFDKFGLADMPDVVENHYPFDAEMAEVILQIAPKVASFHFGLPDQAIVQKLRAAGIVILSSATSVAEAKWLSDNGADAVIAQGVEAGGHNGWFLPRDTADVSTTFTLIPRIVDAIDLPVIAAGGIADGRTIRAALALGAAGVQIGTAFVASIESSVSDTHKSAIIDADGDSTIATMAFSGRSARGLTNAYTKDMSTHTEWPEFPLMNTVTGPMRAASAKADSPDGIALWAGQAVGMAGGGTTREIFDNLVKDTFNV